METESLHVGQFAGGGKAAATWTTVQVTNIQRMPVLEFIQMCMIYNPYSQKICQRGCAPKLWQEVGTGWVRPR